MKDEQNKANAVTFTKEKPTNNGLKRAMIVFVALLFAASCFLIGMLVGRRTDKRESSLLWMIDAVEKNYREDVSRDELYDRLYDALALDRFCAHYTPEEYAEKVREREGENAGYGISITSEGAALRVARVIGNSPVCLAGIESGMYLYSVGGETPATSADAVAVLTAAEGDVVLSCGWTADGSDARAYTVRRASYLASYCTYADSEGTFGFRGTEELVLTEIGEGVEELPAGTAYLRLAQFEGNAAQEFEACLKQMKARGRTDLILDLRGNGGGYLSILCEIAAHLLRGAEGDHPLVMQARYRDGSKENYRANGNDYAEYFNENSRIRVLADENSASASEALIGALIDYGTCNYPDLYLRKGTGEARTYGKGVMQTHFIAPDGNVLQLTVANIYWPNGNYIHGTGITEADGAVPVAAPALCGKEDVFLQAVCAMLA